ncbi:hypothetical protein ABVK25_007990 [Lepraria finkii]|uniref:Uncharacterized protein n=1 Tax=Lepraria finkii TaxID=1340010 RepID=A0ABR4B1V7_9LECA
MTPDSDPNSNSETSSSEQNGAFNFISSFDSASATNIGQQYKSRITRYGQSPPGTLATDKICQGHKGACGNNP